MTLDSQIVGLSKVGEFIKSYLALPSEAKRSSDQDAFALVLSQTTRENSWFNTDNLTQCLTQWASVLTQAQLKEWTSKYPRSSAQKRVGLILAGNIPLVGFHDVISVVLSGHIPLIKLSSKDKRLLPFLLELWNRYAQNQVPFEFCEKLENFDAVIATGSNNTARHLEYYFKDYPRIIRKNRTSIAVLEQETSDRQIQDLAKDIFTYFGLGCRNVTYLLIPADFKLDRLFENFLPYSEIINHNGYANNYDYNKALYLLNQDLFWDNNFVMLRESAELFSPLSVLHFSRYHSLEEAKSFLDSHKQDIQCVVTTLSDFSQSVLPGEAQNPSLSQYADHIDTMSFLSDL